MMPQHEYTVPEIQLGTELLMLFSQTRRPLLVHLRDQPVLLLGGIIYKYNKNNINRAKLESIDRRWKEMPP